MSGNTAGLGRPGPSKGRRSRTRVMNGVASSFQKQSEDFLCPICFEVIEEAMMTRCGHTFCNRCIVQSIQMNSRCPKCSRALDEDNIYPNFLLNELITKHRRAERTPTQLGRLGPAELQEYLTAEASGLGLPNVTLMLELLEARRAALEADSFRTQSQLLSEFLASLKRQREDMLSQLQREIRVIDADLARVDGALGERRRADDAQEERRRGAAQADVTMVPCVPSLEAERGALPADAASPEASLASDGEVPEGFNVGRDADAQSPDSDAMARRRRQVHIHFDDLVKCYFSLRPRAVHLGAGDEEADGAAALDTFSDALSRLTRFSGVRPLASLNYSSDLVPSSSIVSSIEFDKDRELFAIAGVTKKIKIYDYGFVVRNAIDIHYPTLEMACTSKISCVAWNGYHKSVLASSDYEGAITVWDTATGQQRHVYQEHEKRCWSVDFNLVDTNLIASGSDDFTVKLWATNASHSILSLEAKVNVCCVKFNPSSRFQLAFGSADHSVHYYDLRNIKEPLRVFKGHQKAVSYVKFVSDTDLVSASTDSQLKLWNVNSPSCLRSFHGHVNEKNFVGLATDGNYVACGSENNSLYIYYKGLSQSVLSYKFESPRSLLERERADDGNQFVSAVCCKSGSNVVVAANSQGTIKVLELY
ncbi:E3 ubiquitin-protein ligase COP1-like [Pollicipes pollicipes]|uniref:E3 ubiquitin-protein ligase COP1-like n=1 Tax=Pollicipes pollicipes TaxID=41117 RepID=UPI0018858A10|nr:E3 ubiquitin-protein ligase COP1-like [Pollicipes pollicipes]